MEPDIFSKTVHVANPYICVRQDDMADLLASLPRDEYGRVPYNALVFAVGRLLTQPGFNRRRFAERAFLSWGEQDGRHD